MKNKVEISSVPDKEGTVELEGEGGGCGTKKTEDKDLSPSGSGRSISPSSVELSISATRRTSTVPSPSPTEASSIEQNLNPKMDFDEDMDAEQSSLVQYFPYINIFNQFNNFSLVEILVGLIILIVCVYLSGSGRSSRLWFKWGHTTMDTLKTSEESILEAVNTPLSGILVNLGPVIDENDSKIWTIVLNEEKRREATPLVLVHGLGSGVALWAKNLDALAKGRTVYAFDVLGFGRSSRTVFSSDPVEAERQFVESIEAWRIEMKIDKMVLLGHSLGGYLSTSYTLTYPSRVAHLILADPWGFNTQPSDLKDIAHIPLLHRIIVKVMEPLNPLWTIRLFGPFVAPKLIQRIRADLISQFEDFLEDPSTKISNYIYHCNVQNPTGEAAFHCMMVKFGWAKNPMHLRLEQLDPNIAMTVIYGAQSWVDHFPIEKIREARPRSSVGAYIMQGAGHHVYADKTPEFNAIVNRVSAFTDDEHIIHDKSIGTNTPTTSATATGTDSNENYLDKETSTRFISVGGDQNENGE